MFPIADTALFDSYIDDCLSRGINHFRMGYTYGDSTSLARSQAAAIRTVAKGGNVTWLISFNSVTGYLRKENWAAYAADVLTQAAWAQDNGVYEFQIGNEEELHNYITPTSIVRSSNVATVTTPTAHGLTDVNNAYIWYSSPDTFDKTNTAITVTGATTFTYASVGDDGSVANPSSVQIRNLLESDLQDNLKTSATAAQAVFTRGNISYAVGGNSYYIGVWNTKGRGDIDLLGFNCYVNQTTPTDLANIVSNFGAAHAYLTEFSLHTTSLAAYSSDDNIQAVGLGNFMQAIQNAGITRANFFCYKGSDFSFSVESSAGVKRLLWNNLTTNNGRRWFINV